MFLLIEKDLTDFPFFNTDKLYCSNVSEISFIRIRANMFLSIGVEIEEDAAIGWILGGHIKTKSLPVWSLHITNLSKYGFVNRSGE